MANPNYNLIKFIRRCVYQMKREYGGCITVYKLESASTDRATGLKEVSRTSYPINRAIVLPTRLKREVIQSISLISANKQIVQGGMFDTGTRIFIIDRRDASFDDLNNDDWIVYEHKRFELKWIDEFEQQTAWLIVGKELEGASPQEDLPVVSNNYLLNLTQTASATVA